MRIISKFRDYYDCMQGQGGYGSEPLYLRNKEEVVFKKEDYPLLKGHGVIFNDNPLLTTKFCTIGFCGKVYHCVTAYYRYSAPLFRACDFDEFESHVKQFNNEIQDAFYGKRKKWQESMAVEMKKGFASLKSKEAKDLKFFEGKMFPVFVGTPNHDYSSNGKIVINERLSSYEFYRVFPPPQAFQEIQMYLSNLAWPNKPIPKISNNDLIEAKGFDLKTSFRKEKQHGNK